MHEAVHATRRNAANQDFSKQIGIAFLPWRHRRRAAAWRRQPGLPAAPSHLVNMLQIEYTLFRDLQTLASPAAGRCLANAARSDGSTSKSGDLPSGSGSTAAASAVSSCAPGGGGKTGK